MWQFVRPDPDILVFAVVLFKGFFVYVDLDVGMDVSMGLSVGCD